MLYIHERNQPLLDEVRAFTKANPPTVTDVMTFERAWTYLDTFGSSRGEGQEPDHTRWVLKVTPTGMLGIRGFSILFYRRQSEEVLTRDAVTAMLLDPNSDFDRHYRVAMEGGLVYHNDVRGWMVHT